MTPSALMWCKSSYSGSDEPDCVEVAISPTPEATVHVRDSKNKDGAQLAFERGSWAEFIDKMLATP